MERIVLLAVMLVVGCASEDSSGPRTPIAGSTGGSGGDAVDVDAAGGATTPSDGSDETTSEGGSPYATTDGPVYHPSCDAEVCTSDEKCVTMTAGSRCMHACAGQLPCDPNESCFCTRQGGALCLPN